MTRSLILFFILLLTVGCQTQDKTTFHYGDLELFQNTINALDAESDSLHLFENYIESASPGLQGWSSRYRVSAELFMQRYPGNKSIYDILPKLEKPLKARESHIEKSIENLRIITQNDLEIPVYYFVSNQHILAGTPILADSIISAGVAVGIGPDTDRTQSIDLEQTADLIAQIAVHEAAHIFQVNGQGGSETYRSIYDSEKGSMAAIAIREGCAEYVTYLASGYRFGDRHLYVDEHEEELWTAFKEIAFEPPFSVPGWFSGRSEENPDWPFQVGYSLGFNMCESYHLSANNPEDQLKELVTLYNPDDIRRIWDTYEEKF